jgi:SAM-dependent methyltransferase
MTKASVNLKTPSPYLEKVSFLYKIKRKLTYAFAIRGVSKVQSKANKFSILEIGTGSGYFLSFIHSEFPNATLFGIEYDPRLLKETKKKVPFANVSIGNAELFSFIDQKFDVIVSFQVIEHLYNPVAMLECVRKHLSPNGIFILTTPNLDGFGAKIMKNKWHGYRDDHVSLKGFMDWKGLIEKNGFQPVYCGSTFFSGIPILNSFPLGLFNWGLLVVFGTARWKYGESFVGIFRLKN